MKWFRNISIAKKLYFVIGIMALLIALELGTLAFAVHTLSAVRAAVASEGYWSKVQRDMLYTLQKYVGSGNEVDYRDFLSLMKVHSGDKMGFGEIGKEHPDLDAMRRGFIEGGAHPDDVDGMITLFLRFNSISYISRAIQIFHQADVLMSGLQKSAEHIHSIIDVDQASGAGAGLIGRDGVVLVKDAVAPVPGAISLIGCADGGIAIDGVLERHLVENGGLAEEAVAFEVPLRHGVDLIGVVVGAIEVGLLRQLDPHSVVAVGERGREP